MDNNLLNVDANKIIKSYQDKLSKAELESTIAQEQIQNLLNKIKELEDQVPKKAQVTPKKTK